MGRRLLMINNNSSLWRYFKTDLYRSIYSPKFIVAVIGIVIALFAGFIDLNGTSNVFYVYTSILFGMYFMLTFVFCTFCYGDCFCDDFENNYYRYALIRGDVKKYVLSKVLCIIITSILIMVIGITLFVLILRCFLPWIIENDTLYTSAIAYGKFKFLLSQKQFLLYYISSAFQIGMYASILSLIAVLYSMYISNKLLIIIIPAMAHYAISELLSKSLPFFNSDLFIAYHYVLKNTTINFIAILSITVLCSLLLYFAILFKMKRRIENE